LVTVQQGAGAENAFSGIAHAYTDSSPMLFLPRAIRDANSSACRRRFDAVPNYAATTQSGPT